MIELPISTLVGFGICVAIAFIGVWGCISTKNSEIKHLRQNHVTVIYDASNGTVRIEEGERRADM